MSSPDTIHGVLLVRGWVVRRGFSPSLTSRFVQACDTSPVSSRATTAATISTAMSRCPRHCPSRVLLNVPT
ncbi:hypothetical protein HMPREF1979_00794 [Actinomyces johnsonii F0542]|uniref:Uncharacterized protein n=1 Tax=Actinomyces johnsonii F0542 TaxID=1321818 RepID=U1QU87_9ACTO|nr:hypothetical protein HMPREF1979_00794 [Actinomyces johnsonii F0542]